MSAEKEADVAQVVAHLIGSEEVTGPSPVISSFITAEVPRDWDFCCFYISRSSRRTEEKDEVSSLRERNTGAI